MSILCMNALLELPKTSLENHNNPTIILICLDNKITSLRMPRPCSCLIFQLKLIGMPAAKTRRINYWLLLRRDVENKFLNRFLKICVDSEEALLIARKLEKDLNVQRNNMVELQNSYLKLQEEEEKLQKFEVKFFLKKHMLNFCF